MSAHPIWTADALPTDEQLKQFDKDPATVVAAFRLMAGIPPDPRIPSANLDFQVNNDEIIERFSQFCGHDTSIRICGACRVGDVMAAGEFYELPLTHKRVALLECSEDHLQQLSQNRRNSMYLLKHEGKAYNLDAVAFDEKKKVVIICALSHIHL